MKKKQIELILILTSYFIKSLADKSDIALKCNSQKSFAYAFFEKNRLKLGNLIVAHVEKSMH